MKLSDQLVNREWRSILQNEFNEKYFKELNKLLDNKKSILCPREEDIFRALNLVSYNNVKVVIIGQEPFSTKNSANGLAFSSNGLPPPLKNIFKEIKSDIGVNNTNGDLTILANQGVLLLNRILTTEVGKPLAHENEGWEEFTNKIIKSLDNRVKPVVFLLWGKKAESIIPLITGKQHLVLTTSHPSAYSANNGFLGCKHFSKTNEFLTKTGQRPINWSTDQKERRNDGIFK